MEHQDRLKGRLQSYPGPCEHQEVLPLRYNWKDLSVPCASVWSFNSTKRVHQDLGPVSSAASHQRDQSPCIYRGLDHPCGLTRPECSTYTTDYPAFTNLGMDYQLEEVYTRTLTHSRLLGSVLQSRTSDCFFTRLLRFSHQCPIPSISIHGHACTQNNFYQWTDLSLCPLYPSRPPTAQVPPVLDKETVVATHTALGHPDPTGFGISHTSTLVQQKRSTSGSPTASPGTHPVLTLFFFTDASLTGWGASWQTRHLSGQWSPQEYSQHINWLELEAIRLAIFQWCNQIVRVYCDNSTAVAYICKQGGTHSISFFNKTLELFHLRISLRFFSFPPTFPECGM